MSERLFIASPARLDNYAALQEALNPFVHGRWVREAQLHMTWLFLGERFSAEEAGAALEALDVQWGEMPLGPLRLLKGRILYATVQAECSQPYAQLCKRLGMEAEPFLPHVTLMRVKTVVDKRALEAAFETLAVAGSLLPRMELVRSLLSCEGAEHTVLKRLA